MNDDAQAMKTRRIGELFRELAELFDPGGSARPRANAVASDDDLDGEHGDPRVKFDPKRWKGPSHKGRLFSACDPAFLEELAGALDYAADHPKPGKEKYATYDRRDAARARGWAARNRANPPAAEPEDRNPFEPPVQPTPNENWDADAPGDEWGPT